ncbi:hypothetical protein, partial [Mesorhizobium sp. M0323]|uniref:hypothetical protein n=1 Tax=Mesorhizobium sp. M0323 TaxID=2956938 RepID=UPI00333A643C
MRGVYRGGVNRARPFSPFLGFLAPMGKLGVADPRETTPSVLPDISPSSGEIGSFGVPPFLSFSH